VTCDPERYGFRVVYLLVLVLVFILIVLVQIIKIELESEYTTEYDQFEKETIVIFPIATYIIIIVVVVVIISVSRNRSPLLMQFPISPQGINLINIVVVGCDTRPWIFCVFPRMAPSEYYGKIITGSVEDPHPANESECFS